MSQKFIFVCLLLWGAFLVLIATFAGKAGADAAGGAAGVSVILVLLYGLWKGSMML